jgi:hypothetical protein
MMIFSNALLGVDLQRYTPELVVNLAEIRGNVSLQACTTPASSKLFIRVACFRQIRPGDILIQRGLVNDSIPTILGQDGRQRVARWFPGGQECTR